MSRTAPLQIPQADSLARVRHAVSAVARGAQTALAVSQELGISERQASYALHAAQGLGWLEPVRDGEAGEQGGRGRVRATPASDALLATPPGSAAERALLRQSLARHDGLRALVPNLLADSAPSRDELIRSLVRAGLSPSTAKRRATTLLAWRKQIVGEPGRPGLKSPLTIAVGARNVRMTPARRPPAQLALADLGLPAPTLSAALVRDITRDNPWWLGQPSKALPPTRREFVAAIHRRLETRLAPVVVVRGPRQVGKTTAQLQVIADLLRRGVEPRRILRVQFDELPEITALGDSEPILRIIDWYEQAVLQRSLNAAAAEGQPTFLFFDEVQNLSDWAIQLKKLVDGSTTQVVVTGSSALRIEAGRDSLAGRITTLEVGTLTLSEIAAIRGLGDLQPLLRDNGLERLAERPFWDTLCKHGQAQATLRDAALHAFSERGGYPLCHERAEVPWDQVAAQLNETIIQRVIQHDLRASESPGRKRDPQLLEELFRLCCRYAGQAPSLDLFVREIQRALHANVGAQRVRHYLDFLDRTLLVRLVRPLEIRLKKIRGASKLCLADHGLRASWLQELCPIAPADLAALPDLADLAGRLVESIVGAYLMTFGGLQLTHFPMRPGEPEVDFVLTIGTQRIPLEVKYRRRIDVMADTEGLRSFIERSVNRAPFGILVTQSDDVKLSDHRIVPISLANLLLLR
ncbi:MAG: ATP-binding protein [Polyangia bacterium]